MTTPKKPGRRKDPRSKRSRKVDRNLHPRIVLHLPQAWYDELEEYAKTYYGSNRSEALRVILAGFFDWEIP